MSASDMMFAETFTLPGLAFTRCAKPEGVLQPVRHFEFALPNDLGRAHVDVYAAGTKRDCPVARVYHWASGCMAWYAVDLAAQPDVDGRAEPSTLVDDSIPPYVVPMKEV